MYLGRCLSAACVAKLDLSPLKRFGLQPKHTRAHTFRFIVGPRSRTQPHIHNAMADATASADDELLLSIQRALKPPTSSAPKLEHLAVAVALARDPKLVLTATCKAAGFKSSGTRTTIMGYRNRIVNEQLLTARPPVEQQLLVQQPWINEHAPRVCQLACEPLMFSADGQQATRVVSASIDGLDEVVRSEIKYDLSPTVGAEAQKQRRDMHRRREERAIRGLDAAAVEAHKAQRAEQMRAQRQMRREVIDVLANLIERVERQAVVEAQSSSHEWWCCPAGCQSDTACARVEFRERCVPTRAEIERQLQRQWEAEHWTRPGEFRSSYSGCRFGVKEQTRLFLLQEAMWRGKKPSFECSDLELVEIRDAFLSTWDGVVMPARWLQAYLGRGRIAMNGGAEFCGEPAKLDPDRFGHHAPVGPAACARRDCMGCCYCLGVALPVYVELFIFRPKRNREVRWVSISKLRLEMQQLAAGGPQARGCVACVPGTVRAHFSASCLAEWQERLASIEGRLVITRSDSCNCILDTDETTQIHEHVAKGEAVIDRKWEAIRQQERAAAEWQKWFRHAKMQHTSRSLGGALAGDCDQQRNGSTVGPPALRQGDIVHRPQPQGRPHKLAVVMEVVTTRSRMLKAQVEKFGGDGAEDWPALRTGDVNLAMYDEKRSSFTHIEVHVPEAEWMLFPPCCGRGYGCPGMRWIAIYRWPTGDRLDPLEVLRPIPLAFAGFLGAREHYWRRRQALEQQFKALLCGHRIREASNAGTCELSDEQSEDGTEAWDSDAECDAEDEACYEASCMACHSDSEAEEVEDFASSHV